MKRSLVAHFLIAATLAGLSPRAVAASNYVAMGASDAVGVGASNYDENNPSKPNNGYVYRIQDGLKAKYPHWSLVNLGISGATAPEIQRNTLANAISRRPAIVTVWAGGNDVKNSMQAKEDTEVLRARFEAAYETIIRRLRQETGAFIVTANLPDFSRMPIALIVSAEDKKRLKDGSIALNGVINRVAAAYTVPVVDLFNDPETYKIGNLAWDFFHPNDKGYARMATKYLDVINPGTPRVVAGLGDVNNDGAVSVPDAVEILRAIGGMKALDARAALAADTSPAFGDRRVDINDATRLLRRALYEVPDVEWR